MCYPGLSVDSFKFSDSTSLLSVLKAVKFADIAPDLVSESFTKRHTSPKLTYLSATLLAIALMCCIIIFSADLCSCAVYCHCP